MEDKTPQVVTMTTQELRTLIADTVNTTLMQLGIEHDDPLEMQRDFQHLRDWRKSMERIKNRTVITAVGVVVMGLMAAFWIGFRQFLAE